MPPTETDTDTVLAVVVSKLDGLVEQVTGLSIKMDDRPTWQDVNRIERNLEHRISTLEQWTTWAGRLVAGTIVTGVITAVFIFRP